MPLALASRAPLQLRCASPRVLQQAATRALGAGARCEHATTRALAAYARGEHATTHARGGDVSRRALATGAASTELSPSAVVVGGGVTGLTCALRLLERGFSVRLVARDRPERCVSVGAGAIWEYPPFKVEPQERAREWTLASRTCFEAIVGAAGVRLLRAHYLYRSAAAAPAERLSPPYASLLRGFLSGPGAVPASAGPAFVTGYSHVIPVVDMALYLPWLEALVTAAGGALHWGVSLQRLSDAYDAAHPPHVVVNCAALGAAQLAGDAAMMPVRGIKVYVHAPGVDAVYSAEPRDASPDFTTVIPRALGGIVACSGVAQPGETSLQVTDAEVDAVLERCTALVPALRGAPVVGTWAGLRPLRAAAAGGVRLEAEGPDEGRPAVVHCYGHGGAGVITSWGCAADVASLAAQAAQARGATLRRRELLQLAAGLPPLQH